VKPVQVTEASHLNLVACDTGSWEQAAVFQLEQMAKAGTLICYVRNDRLEFNVPYEMYDNAHVYEPDFLVRLANGVTVIVEVKGRTYDNTDVKHQAARRWVSAVNHWGRLGQWDFLPCRDPQKLATEICRLTTPGS
jgi:type III restriction enzyme